MVKKLIFPIILSFFLFFYAYSETLATSGCGGSTPCLSTKIVTSYTCVNPSGDNCYKQSLGTETINCEVVTEEQCYGYKPSYKCDSACQLVEANTNSGSNKTSCCSNAGGGNFSCEGIITWNVQCIPPAQCKTGPQGSCGFNR